MLKAAVTQLHLSARAYHRVLKVARSVADLADQAGISRSALVERFTRFLSEPPMTYLTRWRLQLAARSLERTSRGVAEIAAEVGYESEAAFNRRFLRCILGMWERECRRLGREWETGKLAEMIALQNVDPGFSEYAGGAGGAHSSPSRIANVRRVPQ